MYEIILFKSINVLTVERDSCARCMLQSSTENCYLHKFLSSHIFKWIYLFFLASAQRCYTSGIFLTIPG